MPHEIGFHIFNSKIISANAMMVYGRCLKGPITLNDLFMRQFELEYLNEGKITYCLGPINITEIEFKIIKICLYNKTISWIDEGLTGRLDLICNKNIDIKEYSIISNVEYLNYYINKGKHISLEYD